MAGTIYVVPNLLGVVPPDAVLPARTIQTARRLSHWVVETPKAARAFLKALDVARPIATLEIEPIAQASDARCFDTALTRLGHDHDVGLLSDAGCSGVADPGAAFVARALEQRIRVVP